MITLANIKRSIYNICKRLDMLEASAGTNPGGGGSSGGGFSGDYNDLRNKPTIPAAQIQSDWNQTDNTKKDYIKNKPTLFSGNYNDLSNKPGTADANGHAYVEIAGIKWVTMNIGANSITDAGLYFQWGDTSGYTASQVGSGSDKKYFDQTDYKYCDGTEDNITKYNSTDGKTVLDLSDDAARANWGGSWRTPTTAEFAALGAAVNTEWTSDYQGSGVAGLVCTDKTDSSKVLFFPACGNCSEGSVSFVGSYGNYQSSSLGDNNVILAYRLQFGSSNVNWQSLGNRLYGFPVRGILEITTNEFDKVAFTGNYNDLKNKPTIPSIWRGTQAQYDLLTPDNNTIYIIEAASS